ncbi:cytosol aminopeptidase [Streptomyces violaceorubidus]
MKCDMAGAAAVFAAVVAAARLGLEVNVTGWLALAENMPSGSATRPGDVLRMYSGKTVEVLNTDAEGRLVLADALWAASQDKPDAIIDVATLTGAMMLALGSRTYGIMANDDAFRSAVHEAAEEESGEPAWPMPLPEHLRKGMDSPTADIAHWASGWAAVWWRAVWMPAKGITWAHLDIAGPAFNEAGRSGTRRRAARVRRCGRWYGSPSGSPSAIWRRTPESPGVRVIARPRVSSWPVAQLPAPLGPAVPAARTNPGTFSCHRGGAADRTQPRAPSGAAPPWVTGCAGSAQLNVGRLYTPAPRLLRLSQVRK